MKQNNRPTLYTAGDIIILGTLTAFLMAIVIHVVLSARGVIV